MPVWTRDVPPYDISAKLPSESENKWQKRVEELLMEETDYVDEWLQHSAEKPTRGPAAAAPVRRGSGGAEASQGGGGSKPPAMTAAQKAEE